MSSDGSLRSQKAATARHLETVLRGDPMVQDCRTVRRRDESGRDVWVAYVVPRGDYAVERLAEAARRWADELPEAVLPVPVSSLPLDGGGGVDEAALAALPVLDDELARRWEEAWKAALPASAVILRPHVPPETPFHVTDLPGGSRPDATPADPAAAPRTVESRPEEDRPAHAAGPPLEPLPGEPPHLPAALRRAARRPSPAGVGHLGADGSFVEQTYGELLAEGERCLGALRAAGLRAGAPVLLQIDRSRWFFPALWGCLLGGMVPVPVTVPTAYDDDGAAKLESAWHLFEGPPVLAAPHLVDPLRDWASRRGLDGLRVLGVDELLRQPRDEAHHEPATDDVALILLTSGSTGRPKGVPLTHGNVLRRSRAKSEACGLGADDVSLNWMPLDHVGGVVAFHLRDVRLGSRQLHGPTDAVLRRPLTWLDWMDRHRVTATWAPNFAFGLINDCADEVAEGSWDLSPLHLIVNAGEAIVARTARRFLALLAPHGLRGDAMQPAFGMSETTSGIAYSRRFQLALTSDDDPFVELGAPVAGTEIRVVGEDGELLREGQVGRMQVRGVTVTPGYYRNPQANAEAFTADGWFDSGDLGFLRDGRLTISGRGKDVIIVHGANFYSHEIESVVEELAGVEVSYTAACPVRLAGSDGDRLAIFLVTDLQDEARRDLLRRVRETVVRRLGVRPDVVLPLPRQEVPKTAIGKIQRSALRQRFESGDLDALLRDVEVEEGGARTVPRWFFASEWRRRDGVPSGAPAEVAAADRLLLMPAATGSEPAEGGSKGAAGAAAVAATLASELPGRCYVLEPVAGEAAVGLAEPSPRRFRLDPTAAESRRRLVQRFAADGFRPTQVIHLGGWLERSESDGGRGDDWVTAAQRTASSGLALAPLLGELAAGREEPLTVVALSRGARRVSVDETAAGEPALDQTAVDPRPTPWLALLRAQAQESSDLVVRSVDLGARADAAEALAALRGELAAADGEAETAWRAGVRWVPRLRRLDFAPSGPADARSAPRTEVRTEVPPNSTTTVAEGNSPHASEVPGTFRGVAAVASAAPVAGGFFVLTGGLGEVGAEVAAWLLRRHRARLLLVGRGRPAPAAGDRRAAVLRRLNELGEVRYAALDVADGAALAAAVEAAEAAWGRRMDGAFHLAGVYREARLDEETPQGLAAALLPKAAGASHLYRLLAERGGGALVLFSSLAGSFAAATLGAYGSANHALDAFAEAMAGGPVAVRAVAWSAWHGLGVARQGGQQGDGASDELARIRGFLPLSVPQALASLEAALHRPEPCVLVGLDGHHPFVRGRRSSFYGLAELAAFHAADLAATDPATAAPPPPRDRFGVAATTAVVRLDEMPRDAAGEVDRAALTAAAGGGAPEGEMEELVAACWQEALELTALRRDDHFFVLGGDSLLGTRMLALIERRSGVELVLRDLFAAPTLATFAARLDEARGSAAATVTASTASAASAASTETLDTADAAALLDRMDELDTAEVDRLLAALAGEDEA